MARGARRDRGTLALTRASGLAARLGESSGTLNWHLRQLAEHGFIEVVAFLGEDWNREWYESSTAAVSRLRPEELRALNEEVLAVVDRYRAQHPPDADERRTGEELVVTQFQSFPRRAPEPS